MARVEGKPVRKKKNKFNFFLIRCLQTGVLLVELQADVRVSVYRIKVVI